MTAPKLFVSYSWTSPDHEDWVLNLAIDLRASGIEVILDKWHLREGQDANEFMERMVSDQSIEKVIMICDKGYKEKADGRRGGAGIEAQILTPHLYRQKDESKFVAVLSERDEAGQPYVPNYYASRLYIDLSDPSRHGEMFERLVRWAYNRPLHEAPPLGERPKYLEDDKDRIRLSTSVPHTRAVEAMRADKPRAIAIVQEYFSTLITELEKFRIQLANKPNQADMVRDSIEQFLPYRNQFVDLISTLSIYTNSTEAASGLHKFFEKIIGVCFRRLPGSGTTWDPANLRFIAYELFLYSIAVLLKQERFDIIYELVNSRYYVGNLDEFHDKDMVSFEALQPQQDAIGAWWNGKDRQPISPVGELINERLAHTDIEISYICSADLLLAVRSAATAEDHRRWIAWTTVYAGHSHKAFEVFARSQSVTYFNRIKPIIGCDTIDKFKKTISDLDAEGRRGYVTLSGFGSSVASMTGSARIASRP